MGTTSIHPRQAQAGFTIVEALVALVILAIGLLGIAALHLDSLQAGRTAIHRTQAINLAADLADRIRANRAATVGYSIDLAETAEAVAECATTAGCTAADLAATDLATWKASLATLLPAGDGSVGVGPVAAGTTTTYLITVTWSEVGQDDPSVFQLGFST